MLKLVEKSVSHTTVALAATRSLGKLKPVDGAKALLGYLPVADSPAVEEAIRAALIAMAVRDGKPEPALVAALADAMPIRRGVAIVALLEGGNPKERIRIPATFPQVKAAVLAEKDSETRFRGLYSLLTVARDTDGVAKLMELIPDAQRGRIWQIEDYLIQLAGANPPKIRIGGTKEGLAKARDEWMKWWTAAKANTKLETFAYVPKTTGCLLVTTMDQQGWGSAVLREYGPDMKERWKIGGLNAPCEVRMLPGDRFMALEQGYRLTERDMTGKVLVTRQVNNQAMNIQTLPEGQTLLTYRNMVQIMDKDWKATFTYNRATQDIVAAHRLPSGITLVLTGGVGTILRVDDQGKELPEPTKTGQTYYQAKMVVVNDDRVLVTEQNQIAEYDLKTKKQVWKYAVNQATCFQRLANGNTLVGDGNATNQIREVSPEGEVVWTHPMPTGQRVTGIERR